MRKLLDVYVKANKLGEENDAFNKKVGSLLEMWICAVEVNMLTVSPNDYFVIIYLSGTKYSLLSFFISFLFLRYGISRIIW